jgi:hypothetical protein
MSAEVRIWPCRGRKGLYDTIFLVVIVGLCHARLVYSVFFGLVPRLEVPGAYSSPQGNGLLYVAC